MTGSILLQAIVFLAGAVVCVPIAKRFGLSAVLGYLLAGILIGPFLLGFVGEEGEDILHFAEFGVVMMLFLIGLEIEPRNFWNMRKTIVGMGGLQVVVTMGLSFLMFILMGYEWKVALAISMAVALSSTAIVLQTLKEKGLMNTTAGAASFSILLFQDIIVIFMLGALPLLSVASHGAESDDHHGSINLLENLPLGLQTLVIISSVALVVLAGRYLFVPMLRLVAKTGVRELLIASALLIVLAISFLMELAGLSPALGAFLGGVVLATSEFKHELESTLEPFKDLLLGLFFMAVGASINFVVVSENPLMISGLVIGIILLKALVLFIVGAAFKMKLDQRLLMTVSLAQIGEFAFVLFSFAFQLEILGRAVTDMMLVVTAISMTLTPILAMLNERLVLPRFGTKESVERPMDEVEKHSKVIIVGFGHFGNTVGRFLRAFGVEPTVLDFDSNRVDFLRKMGFKVFYGDASRMDLLESAGIAEADILITTIGNPGVTADLVKQVRKKYPHVKLMVRAQNRYDAYELLNIGVENVYRESLDTSVKLASDVLSEMGFRKYTLHRQAQQFIRSDEESLRRLASQPRNEAAYIFKARQEIAAQEKLLEEDRRRGLLEDDHLWDSEQMRMAKQ
ncbi:monovalent cation:proton antiporter-2 (CPA2) family protein [Phaeodactylibacter sp.]|uniref:monovalent cation:proton antiporter-2 (CPA2) family protein n=1 Tax=Phaeodactylibacter sp. TaxID=1940289 RepID=UPI0025FEE17C|nr:monovalent cation:proton antiporter-2 (CPA2) family protein [Phaeodactylibacter sp.]MCI4651303.1 monovalent cation:proton antiporter-2 (CPA2) family protein [Phaeodactylibacter sp.]MCI5092488.1 monovalent cation:proton antiporter-2 (CPA2) family protein [Phaeodactylibacter sp.]